MMAFCSNCGTLWTNKQTTTKVDVKRVPRQSCVDCQTFDYPIYTKRREEAAKQFTKPNKDKASK